MENISLAPFIIVLVITALLRGLQRAVLVLIDAHQRGLKTWIFWGILTFFSGGLFGAFFYVVITKRPQSFWTLSLPGLLWGNRLEKMRKWGSTILISAFWINAAFILRGGLIRGVDPTATRNFVLLWAVFAIIAFVYLRYELKYKGLSPLGLGKPLWGMRMTPQGPIDTSLEKNKKAVWILIAIITFSILAGILFFFIF